MSKQDGGSAFPEIYTDHRSGEPDTYSAGGMTLRDYFAAKALAGLTVSIGKYETNSDLADHAYTIAACMLEARSINGSASEPTNPNPSGVK